MTKKKVPPPKKAGPPLDDGIQAGVPGPEDKKLEGLAPAPVLEPRDKAPAVPTVEAPPQTSARSSALMRLYTLTYRDQFQASSVVIEARDSIQALAVADAWCKKQSAKHRAVGVKPFVVAGPEILEESGG